MSGTEGAASSRTRFVALDSWRGIAALMVALFHIRLGSHMQAWPVVQHGFLFVDFFFVLSGFVIHHAYGARLTDRRSLAGFAVRRFGRLWPLHATVLVLFLLLVVADRELCLALRMPALLDAPGGRFTGKSFVTNLLLVHALGIEPTLTWNGPSWSISTEFFTYLLFGVIAVWAAARVRPALFFVISIVSAAVVARFSPRFMDAAVDFGLFRCFFGFFIGCCTHEIAMRYAPFASTPRRSMTVLEIACVLAAALLISRAGAGPLGLAGPIVFAAVVVIFSHEKGSLSSILRSRFFRQLGERSYSIYMVHALLVLLIMRSLRMVEHVTSTVLLEPTGAIPIQTLAGNAWQADIATVATLIVLIWLSGISYRAIELPARKAFNRIAAERIDGDSPSYSSNNFRPE